MIICNYVCTYLGHLDIRYQFGINFNLISCHTFVSKKAHCNLAIIKGHHHVFFFRVQQDHIPSQTYRKSDKNSSSNNTKSMPDLKHSDLMQELKHRQEEIKNFSSKIGIPSSKSPSVISGASRLNSSNNCHHDQEVKSFSSRFVSQTKPPPPSKTHLIFMAIFFFLCKAFREVYLYY